jgi:hypothetical protein
MLVRYLGTTSAGGLPPRTVGADHLNWWGMLPLNWMRAELWLLALNGHFSCHFTRMSSVSLQPASGKELERGCAGAGCGSLATGLVQLTWVLDGVLRRINTTRPAFLSREKFASAQAGLFIWEAFASGSTKGKTHINDAQAAVQAFQRALPDPMKYNAIRGESTVYSLAGAALLRSGWCRDVSIMEEACLVIRA